CHSTDVSRLTAAIYQHASGQVEFWTAKTKGRRRRALTNRCTALCCRFLYLTGVSQYIQVRFFAGHV
ncbi:hypothetical protein ABTE85_20615, partial [Acinetobacter baumannii]